MVRDASHESQLINDTLCTATLLTMRLREGRVAAISDLILRGFAFAPWRRQSVPKDGRTLYPCRSFSDRITSISANSIAAEPISGQFTSAMP